MTSESHSNAQETAPAEHSTHTARAAPAGAWCGALAGTVAAAYGLGHAAQVGDPSLPAHELHGLLAAALALAGWAGWVGWPLRRPAFVQALRWLAITSLLAAAVQAAMDVALGAAPPPGPHLGPITGAGLAVALVILALTWLPLTRPLSGKAVLATQLAVALLWAVVAAALCALIPARMLIDWQPLNAGLSWPATLVLALLAGAATARVYAQPALRAYFAEREDRRIFASSLAMLFGAVAIAALLVAGLLTVRAIEAIEPVLHHSTTAQALALDQLMARVDAAARDAVADLWPGGASAVPAPVRLQRLRGLRQLLDPFGQVGIRLQDGAAEVLVEGRFDESAGPRLTVGDGRQVAILDRQGFVLQVERQAPRGTAAGLAIQIRPFHADRSAAAAEWLGTSPDVMLCASDGAAAALCLTRAAPQGLRMPLAPRADGQLWPVQRAWRGIDGVVLLRDPARAAAAVAYAPVGSTGLGVVQKLLLAPVVQRLTASVPPVLLLLLLAVGAAGAWLLYRRSFPALRALRYAKAHLQATLEHLPLGVLTLDAQGGVLSANAGAHRLFGRDEEALRGRPIDALIAASGGGPAWRPHSTGEALARRADGTDVPVDVVVQGFHFEGAACTVLIVRDLRRELAQRAELSRWERIFFHADWGVAASSDDGQRIELVNPAYAAMHGYTVDELRQRPVIDVFAPQARAELPAHIARIHAEGHHRFESWHQRRDGSIFPVLVDATLVQEPGSRRRFRVVNVQDISEQKRAQEAVQRSEALLQLVLKSLPVGVWIADREGRIVALNPAVERLWKGPVTLHDGRLVGHQARRVASGQPIADDDYPMQRAIRTGNASIGELIEITCADGSLRTVMTAAVPLIGADGAIEGAIAVNEDLTTVLRAEAAVVAARRFFESLFQSAALGMAVWNVDGCFERVNQALCELLNRDELALLGHSLAEVAAPEHLAADREMLDGLRSGRLAKVEVERRLRRGDGRSVWALIVVSVVQLPGSEQPQFVVQVLDIDRSRRFQQALQASEARLLNAHRIARLADWEWDPARDEVSLSKQGRSMLGLPSGHPGVLTGTAWLARVHAEDRGNVHAALSEALRGQQVLAIDYRLLLDDGSERHLHQQGERLAGSGSEPPRLVGVLQDITERKLVENELLQSRQRLRDLSANEAEVIEEERRHIAREVHDELGQALTALKMELSLLGRRFGADAGIAAQAQRMGAMLDGTLDIVRHVVSNLRPSALDFGLVAAIEWLAEDFGLRWEMPCEVHVDGQEVTLSDACSTALFRIVQESLTNVARHARAQRVDIRIASDGHLLRLTVRDDGIGFDVAAAQERGASFGLLGQRERALKIGARLRLHSRPGHGTEVDVELPLPAPPAPPT